METNNWHLVFLLQCLKLTERSVYLVLSLVIFLCLSHKVPGQGSKRDKMQCLLSSGTCSHFFFFFTFLGESEGALTGYPNSNRIDSYLQMTFNPLKYGPRFVCWGLHPSHSVLYAEALSAPFCHPPPSASSLGIPPPSLFLLSINLYSMFTWCMCLFWYPFKTIFQVPLESPSWSKILHYTVLKKAVIKCYLSIKVSLTPSLKNTCLKLEKFFHFYHV